MSGDSYISDYKLDEIREEYGDRIVTFSSKPGEYLERCRADYDKVHDFFWRNKGLFFLLGITNVIKTNEVDYEIEHKRIR